MKNFLLEVGVWALFVGAIVLISRIPSVDARSTSNQYVQSMPSVSLGKSRLPVKKSIQNHSSKKRRQIRNAATGNTGIYQSIPDGTRFDPDTRFVRYELLVDSPPAGFSNTVEQFGFKVLEVAALKGLDIQLFHLNTPIGRDTLSSQRLLQRRFPGVLVALNHEVDLARRKSGLIGRSGKRYGSALSKTGSFAREAIGWSNMPKSCGRGVKIGWWILVLI